MTLEEQLREAEEARDLHVAALDSLEFILFGDNEVRSRDELEERAAWIRIAEESLRLLETRLADPDRYAQISLTIVRDTLRILDEGGYDK